MNEPKACHSSFSMGNKMFVIVNTHLISCEVYDNVSRSFTMLTINLSIKNNAKIKAFGVNGMIYIFDSKLNLYAYNINGNNLVFSVSALESSLNCAAFQKCPKF